MNIYEECPILENDNYIIRLIDSKDAADLFSVYNDKMALPFFNGDNCHGSNFYCSTLENVQDTIKYWLMEYHETRGFVRFSIIDKKCDKAVGTIEMFKREAKDYFDKCGLLRLDLRSDYERTDCITDILTLVTKPFFDWFDCEWIATKGAIYAVDRIEALKKSGYTESKEELVGNYETYRNYWIIRK